MKWFKDLNKRDKEIAGLVILTCIAIYVLVMIANQAGPIFKGTVTAVKWVMKVLTPVVVGFIIAYLLYPGVIFFERQLGKIGFLNRKGKSHRLLAVLILALIVVIVLVVVISIIISAVTNSVTLVNTDNLVEFITNISKNISSFAASLTKWLEEKGISSGSTDLIGKVQEMSSKILNGISTYIMNSITNISGFVTNAAFAIVFAVYFLIDGTNLMNYWKRILRVVMGRRAYRYLSIGARDADFVFSGYIRGQSLDAVIMALMLSISFSIIGVNSAVLIGILAGLGNLIPYLGSIIGYGSVILVCLVSGEYTTLVIALIVLFIIQTLDGNVINPRLLSKAIEVHPLLVVVSLIIGGQVGGLLGMLLAVPCGALAKVWFERAIDFAEKRKLAKEQAKTEADASAGAEADTGEDTDADVDVDADADADTGSDADTDTGSDTDADTDAE